MAFEREARTLARLRHPVLPKVSDHFTENEMQYLVMEHISGDDLSKRLEITRQAFSAELGFILGGSAARRARLSAFSRTADCSPGHQAAKFKTDRRKSHSFARFRAGQKFRRQYESFQHDRRQHRRIHAALRADGADSRHGNKSAQRYIFVCRRRLPTFDKFRSA